MVIQVEARVPVNCEKSIFYTVRIQEKQKTYTVKKEGNGFFIKEQEMDLTKEEQQELTAFLREYEAQWKTDNSQ